MGQVCFISRNKIQLRLVQVSQGSSGLWDIEPKEKIKLQTSSRQGNCLGSPKHNLSQPLSVLSHNPFVSVPLGSKSLPSEM